MYQGIYKLSSAEELKTMLKPHIEVVHRASGLITTSILFVSNGVAHTQWGRQENRATVPTGTLAAPSFPVVFCKGMGKAGRVFTWSSNVEHKAVHSDSPQPPFPQNIPTCTCVCLCAHTYTHTDKAEL